MSDKDIEKLSEPFRKLIADEGLNYQFFDMLPIPVEIFEPDGTCMFVNRAMLEINGGTDIDMLVGHYNLREDPVCIEICGKESIERAFRGETLTYHDFPAPIQDVMDRGLIDEKPFEAATMDIYTMPLWSKDELVCVVMFFYVNNMYHGRNDMAKAREYIETHWKEDFDIDKIAGSVNMSQRHFRRIFKDIVKETPMEFYQRIKLENIQEKLLDNSLSVEEAFESCGVDSHGSYFKLFKERVGMTPSEFRKTSLR